jgi:hypothetical protein
VTRLPKTPSYNKQTTVQITTNQPQNNQQTNNKPTTKQHQQQIALSQAFVSAPAVATWLKYHLALCVVQAVLQCAACCSCCLSCLAVVSLLYLLFELFCSGPLVVLVV